MSPLIIAGIVIAFVIIGVVKILTKTNIVPKKYAPLAVMGIGAIVAGAGYLFHWNVPVGVNFVDACLTGIAVGGVSAVLYDAVKGLKG